MTGLTDYLKNDYNLATLVKVTPWCDNFSMVTTQRFKKIYETGYEKFSTRIFKNFINNYDCFVDVGAHYGYYSLLAAKSNEKIKIIAFEPISENFEILKLNLLSNDVFEDRAECFPEVVSSKSEDKVSFYKSEASDNCGIIPHPNSSTLEKIEVKSVKLDDFFVGFNPERLFIKIDTEGNELRVIKCLSDTFKKNENITLLLEINPKMLKLSNSDCTEIIQHLESENFIAFAIMDDKFQFYPLNTRENINILESMYENSYFNILCMRKTKALSVMFFSHTSGLGGAERCLLDLVTGLCQLETLCTIIVPSNGPLLPIAQKTGCAVYEIPHQWRDSTAKAWWWAGNRREDYDPSKFIETFDYIKTSLLPEIKKISPDIIFSQTIASPWGAVCADLTETPHALSVREYGVLDHNFEFFFGFENSMSAFYQASSIILCITEDVKNKIFSDDKEKKIHIIYGGIDEKTINSLANSKINFSYSEKFLTDSLKIGIFGNMSREKCQKDLVNACLYLLRQNINIECIISVSPIEIDYFDDINRLINDSDYPQKFKITDFIENPFPLMKKTDVVVSCSEIEALGRTLIEAILLKKPIIYTNSGGPKEIYTDGLHGLSYSKGNFQELAAKIIQTINDSASTNNRINEAYSYVIKNFTITKYSNRVYDQLLNVKKEKKNQRSIVPGLILSKLNIPKFQDHLIAKLYFRDTSEQFDELNSISTDPINYGLFSFHFHLPGDGFHCLRFDPIENSLIQIIIYKTELTILDKCLINPEINLITNGYSLSKNSWQFFNYDPQIIYNYDERIKSIRITGEITKIPEKYCINVLNSIIDDTNKKLQIIQEEKSNICKRALETENKLQETMDNLYKTRREFEIIQTELVSIHLSRSWRTTRLLRKIKNIITKHIKK